MTTENCNTSEDWRLKRLNDIHHSMMESSFSIKHLAEELIDVGREDNPNLDRLDVVAKITAMKKLGEALEVEACDATNLVDEHQEILNGLKGVKA